MRRLMGLAVLLFVAACRTIEPGTGPLTLSPAVTRSFERFVIFHNSPLGFAVTADGVVGMGVYCSGTGRNCPAGWRDKLVRDCEEISDGRPCYLLAKGRNVVWQGAVTKDGDLDLADLEASAVKYLVARSVRHGVAEAVGAILFLPRQPGQADDDNVFVPPYLTAMNRMGWDILRGNVAPSLYSTVEEGPQPVVDSLAAKIEQLRSAGYEKIIVAGHGTAAPFLFSLTRGEELVLDGVIAVAPSWFSQRSWLYRINYSRYKDEIARLRPEIPIVLTFFHEDEGETQDRFKVTEQTLDEVGVPNFIINKPEEVSGSDGAWDDAFADRFAGCIHEFLSKSVAPREPKCVTGPPGPGDHRWMTLESDLEGSAAIRLNTASLTALLPGNRFEGKAPRGNDVLYEFDDANMVTITGLNGQGPQTYPYRIDDEAFCIGERTCNRVYRWDRETVIVVSASTSMIAMRIRLSPDQGLLLDTGARMQ